MQLIGKPGRVDTEYFWEHGYTVVRGVYSPAEVAAFRAGALATEGPKGDLLSNPLLRGAITDGRLVDIARRILGEDDIMYAGDSSFTVGTQQHGYHKDNADRTDPAGPDWASRYTILRFGIYLQSHRWNSGGLNLRVDSHRSPSLSTGRNIYVRTGLGDVAVWLLTTSHSGNATSLRFPWWVQPEPAQDGKYPRWWRPSPAPQGDRMALFAALGLDDAHHRRYVEYLKSRTYIVNMWRNSAYPPEALAEADAIGLKVRNLPAEIVGDDTVGKNVKWEPIPY